MNPGDTISRYRITGRLGQGGMGVVYKAEDTRLGRPVALKFLPPHSLGEQDRKRLLNEAQSAALIRHPNVCPIYDVEEVEEQTFIAMAYLEGETLDRKIARGAIPFAAAIEIAIQVAEGLQAAHTLGIVHRDIKSSNILITPDGHASILDFGLALRAGETRITAAGHTPGTPAYMSPEQVRGQNIDARSDLWALGVLLFEMITGATPFRREHQSAITHAIIYDDPPSPAVLRPDIPPGLEKIIATALTKDPEKRWHSAREFAAALKRLQPSTVTGFDPTATSAATKTMIDTPSMIGRKRTKQRALAVLCIAAAAFGVYYFARHRTAVPAGIQLPAKTGKQVAVLPFQVADADRSISDGLMIVLTEALSDNARTGGALTAIPASEILSRKINTPAEARRVYGADLAVTGTGERRGNVLHCALQLVDTAAGKVTGSGEFDYDPANSRAGHDAAVEQVSRMLGLQARVAAAPSSASGIGSAGAYSPYLEGRGLLARYDVRGNLDKAVTAFRGAVEQDPNFALAWAGLAEAYWRITLRDGNSQVAALALESAERAVRIDPAIPTGHTVLGMIYGTAGRDEDALRELHKALELAPSNAEAPRELARIYARLGRFADAEASYLKAVKERPTDWYGYLLLGMFYRDRENYGAAETAFKQGLQMAPDNDVIARNLGVLYAFSGRYPEAVEVLQKSLKSRAAARTYLSLGATYYYMHRFQDAASAVETAIDLDSTRDDYWGNLGCYYKWIPGAESKVVPALQKALEIAERRLKASPNSASLHAALAEYRARLGDAKGALADIARIPESERQQNASQIALAYELTGHRAEAIELIRTTIKNPMTLAQIRDDPDLAGLWSDPAFQRALAPALRH